MVYKAPLYNASPPNKKKQPFYRLLMQIPLFAYPKFAPYLSYLFAFAKKITYHVGYSVLGIYPPYPYALVL